MSRDELAVLDGGKCILQLRGVRPFLSDKYDLTQHRQFIPAHKFPAVKSSDEFAKEKTLPVKKTRRVTIINVISCEFSILD